MESSSDDEFFECDSEPVKYYAVAYPRDKGVKGIVTTDINEARSRLKSIRGCRFSSFYDPLEAKRFAEKPLTEENDSGQKKQPKASGFNKKISDPFPNASARDLNVLKLAIESGETERVRDLVRGNPRLLITESDAPTLLQVRFRHNALHVAASYNQPGVIEFVLEALNQLEFWRTLYPAADDRSNAARRLRVIDMYVNSPEIGNLETPLHLASKFGNKECLRALLRERQADPGLKNKAGLRPDQLAGQRCIGELADSCAESVRQIFNEKFVVLKNSDRDRCEAVIELVSHSELLRMMPRQSDDDSLSSFTPPLPIVRAFIGPLPEVQAKQLQNRWTSLTPYATDTISFEEIRRSDAEKGMERHGRYLAYVFGAPWKELWQFDGFYDYANFADDEGLKILDSHLEKIMCNNNSSGSSGDAPIDQTNQSVIEPPEPVHSNSNSFVYDSLVRIFSRLTLKSPNSNDPNTPRNLLSSPQPTSKHKATSMVATAPSRIIPSDVITSTPIRVPPPRRDASTSLRVCRTPFNSSLLGDGILTPTDRQVRQAILSGNPMRYSAYPRVISWLSSLSQIDPHPLPDSSLPSETWAGGALLSAAPPGSSAALGSNRWQPFLSPTAVRITPIKANSLFKQPQIPDFNKSLSPLSQIELTD